MIPPSSSAGFPLRGRVERDAAPAGVRDAPGATGATGAPGPGDAALSFASLLVALLGGGTEPDAPTTDATGTDAASDGSNGSEEGRPGTAEGTGPRADAARHGRSAAQAGAGAVATNVRATTGAETAHRGVPTDATAEGASMDRAGAPPVAGAGPRGRERSTQGPTALRGASPIAEPLAAAAPIAAPTQPDALADADATPSATAAIEGAVPVGASRLRVSRAPDEPTAVPVVARIARGASAAGSTPARELAGNDPIGGAPGVRGAPGAREAGDDREEAGPSRTAKASATSPASAAASAAASGADLRTPDRSMAKLDPEMRAKVERVMERMATEHGSDVVLLEGLRTPERQAWLYAQGRSRPGPVVTWTTSSKHSQGLAADLKVTDAGGQARPYEALQRVATEEGLRVLGMKDPGHVELRPDGAEGEADAEPPAPTPSSRSGTTRVAAPAEPARVAAARAAQVAHVARTATVTAPVAGAAYAATTAYASATASAHSGVRSGAARPAPKVAESGHEEIAVPVQEARTVPVQAGAGEVSAPDAAASAQPLERIERLLEVMEARDAVLGPGARRVSVRLDGTAGPVERVQVQMLDRALSGTVSVDDATLAARLRDTTTELMRTLERGGYDARSIDVASTARAQATHEVLGVAGRSESMADTVRALFATHAGGGREGQDGRSGRGGGDPRGQDGLAHQSRRDDRRKDR